MHRVFNTVKNGNIAKKVKIKDEVHILKAWGKNAVMLCNEKK